MRGKLTRADAWGRTSGLHTQFSKAMLSKLYIFFGEDMKIRFGIQVLALGFIGAVLLGLAVEGLVADDAAYIQKNYVEATQEYTAQASTGESLAILNIGSMHYLGQGVPQDYEKAATWLQLAAEHGDAQSQQTLGWLCFNGLGVPQDYTNAVKWFRLAAEQGDALAQRSLSVMYRTGNGVPRDYLKAYKWFQRSIYASLMH